MTNPIVSVVVTSRNRPQLVVRAVRSVLEQTHRDFELIVVVDGPCLETVAALGNLKEPRMQVHVVEQPSGQAAAMNRGVAISRGRWIAFLDDDDQWLPDKLAVQVKAAEIASHRHPIVAARVTARGEEGDFVWPLRLPDPGEHISEYLFCQRGLRAGEGMVLPSTTMASRELLLSCPMTEGLKRYVDVDWLLRVTRNPDVCIVFAEPERPLAIYDISTHTSRVGNSVDWQYSLAWARERKSLMTARARGGFVLLLAGSTARRAADWAAFPRLLIESFVFGKPSPVELAAYVAIWALPITWRRLLTRKKP